MAANRLTFAALAVACIAAAGVGGYLAARQGAVAANSPTAEPSVAAQPVVQAPIQQPVAPPVEVAPPQVASTPPPPAPTRRAARPTSSAISTGSPRQTVARQAETPLSMDRVSPATVQPTPAPAADPAPLVETQATATGSPEPPAVVEVPTQEIRGLQELVVLADSVIGLRTERMLSSESARVEDRVEARVVRDVRVNGEVAIPAGTRAIGSVVVVERGGRVRDRARLGIRFETLQMADGTRMAISTETIYRYGESPSNGSAAKIGGGAVAGAILGAIIGGGKGAAIGATTGASAGTAAVMTAERNTATFPSGSEVTARILSPVVVTVERN